MNEKLEELLARAGIGSGRAAILLVAVVAAVVVLVAVGWARSGASEPAIATAPDPGSASATSASRGADASAGCVMVDVVGAVRRPGVYTLPRGSRVCAAVGAAGGTTGNAAEGSVNLARVLKDGEQLVVPTKDAAASPAAGGAASAAAGAAASSGNAAGQPVDINHASVSELDALPGIGPSTAGKIVKEREANGPFASVDDLGRVSGIGPKKIEALKDVATAR